MMALFIPGSVLEIFKCGKYNKYQSIICKCVRSGYAVTIAGEVSVGANETEWRFAPDVAWTSGPHRLLVDDELEDPSGNSVRALFEVDAVGRIEAHSDPDTTAVPFVVQEE